MNKVYCRVWSKTRQMMVVASELASSGRKSGRRLRVTTAGASSVMMCFAMASPIAFGAESMDADAEPVEVECAGKAADGTTAAEATVNCVESEAVEAMVGTLATAIGDNSTANGVESSAYGANSYAEGDYSTALGSGSLSLGTGSTAVGAGANAIGDFSVANGYGSVANLDAVAVGNNSQAIGEKAISIGRDSVAGDTGAISIGTGGQAAYFATSVGSYGMATGEGATAFGAGAWALEAYASAVGPLTWASGWGSSAFGYNSTATGAFSVALGMKSIADADGAVAIGFQSAAAGVSSIAIGGQYSCAEMCLIESAFAWGTNATALGAAAQTYADNALALGARARAETMGSISIGFQSRAVAENSIALGANSWAMRDNTVAVGNELFGITRQITGVAAGTDVTDAVNKGQLDEAIAGINGNVGDLHIAAVKYDDSTVKESITLGGDGGTVLRNVKAGSSALDAVNFEQLASATAALGGGASFDGNGAFIAPVYTIQGSGFSDAGSAFGALDGALTGLTNRVNQLEQGSIGIPGGTGNGVAIGSGSVAPDASDTAVGNGAVIGASSGTAVGSNSSISSTATNAVAVGANSNVTAVNGTAVGEGATATASNAVALGHGSVADEANTVSVGSAGNARRVTNIAAGTNATDAANVGQMLAGDAAAVTAAKTYTDTTATQTLTRANAYTDGRLKLLEQQFTRLNDDVWNRLGAQDRRIDRMGAMSAAMMSMSMNAANGRSQNGRLAVGAGWQNGESALSVGYSKQIGERASFSLGGAFTNDDQSAGVGLGIDL